MAVIGLHAALAREYAVDNINVNAIAPGRIWTAFHQSGWRRDEMGDPDVTGRAHLDVFEEAAAEVIPLGRPQTPSDIGALAGFWLPRMRRTLRDRRSSAMVGR